jgi:hypothetical protein
MGRFGNLNGRLRLEQNPSQPLRLDVEYSVFAQFYAGN